MNWPAIVSSMVLACLIGFLAPLVALFVTCLAAMFGKEKTGARNFSHFLFFSGMIIFVGCMTTIVLNLKNIFIPPLSSSFSLQLLLSDKFLPTFLFCTVICVGSLSSALKLFPLVLVWAHKKICPEKPENKDKNEYSTPQAQESCIVFPPVFLAGEKPLSKFIMISVAFGKYSGIEDAFIGETARNHWRN